MRYIVTYWAKGQQHQLTFPTQQEADQYIRQLERQLGVTVGYRIEPKHSHKPKRRSKMMSREQYRKMLARHDWFYHNSDDHGKFLSGQAVGEELFRLAQSSPEFEEDFNAAKNHMFSGPAFGKPEVPKPSWWEEVAS